MDELTRELSGVELMWALHARGMPEPKQGLSRRRIAEAAIALADSEGLDALSMGRVAKALGFTAMSLYRHVRSKDELVLLMQDTAVGPPGELDGSPADGWRAGLERWTWAVLRAFRRHPWILQTILMFGPPATPNHLAWLERGLRTLADTGLTEPEKLSTILLLDAHVFGEVQFTAAGQPSSAAADDPDAYGAMLARVLDQERFPALLAALAGGAFDDGPDDAADRDAYFAFGLARILDGVGLLVAQRAAGER